MNEHAGRVKIAALPNEKALWPAEMAVTAAIRVALAAELSPLAIGDAIRAGYEWNLSQAETNRQTAELSAALRGE